MRRRDREITDNDRINEIIILVNIVESGYMMKKMMKFILFL